MSKEAEDKAAKEAARKNFKPPKTLGACVDAMYRLRADRHAAQRAADTIGAEEELMRTHIIDTFNKDDIEGARGKLASCSITRRRVPAVKDWDKLYQYIHKNKAYELLQRRVHEGAWMERLENKKVVPGVEAFDVIKLSITKL